MKRFIKYLSVVLLGLISIDILFSMAIERVLSSGNIYSLSETNDFTSDILVIGSSRAICHYNPQILSDKLNCKVQVYGRQSENILFHYTIFKAILDKSNTPPKMVFLELAENDINAKPGKSITEGLEILYPFYYCEHSVREELDDLLEPKELFLIKYSGIFRNNSEILHYLKPIFSGKPSSVLVGYLPVNNVWKKPIEEKPEVGGGDFLKIKYLDNFIELCEQRGIQLAIVMSPSYRILRSENWKNIIRAKAKQHNIPIIDHEQDRYYQNHQDWFYDSYHLNEKGASIYSANIAEEIKSISLTDKLGKRYD